MFVNAIFLTSCFKFDMEHDHVIKMGDGHVYIKETRQAYFHDEKCPKCKDEDFKRTLRETI